MSAIPDTFPIPARARPQGRTAIAFALSLAVHVAFFGLLAWSMRGEPRMIVVPVELVFGTMLSERAEPIAEPSSGDAAPAALAAAAAATTAEPAETLQAATSPPVATLVARPAPRAAKPAPIVLAAPPLVLDTAPTRLARIAPSLEAAPPSRAIGTGDATLELAVREWLRRYQHYPRAARRAGLEGTAHVRFVIARDGTLREYELVASSGHAVLDRAALELLERAAPYPALPRRVTFDAVELTLPVEYRLDADATRG